LVIIFYIYMESQSRSKLKYIHKIRTKYNLKKYSNNLKWVFDKEWGSDISAVKNFTEFVTENYKKVVTHIYKYHFNSSAIFSIYFYHSI
jgi:hypothetical protein